MQWTQVSVGLTVTDHGVAVDWYERLFGRGPDRRPMDGLAEWQLTGTASVQVHLDPSSAGRSAVTLGVRDLDERAGELAEAGLTLDRRTTPRGQRLGTISDPDGNLIVFAKDLERPTRRAQP